MLNDSEPKALIFLRFLKSLGKDCSHLFLMGDVFDIWISDQRFFSDRYQAVVEAILRIRDRGVEIHIFEGNHDFHLSNFWEKKHGIQVHSDWTVLQVGPWRMRLEHGDQTNPEDKAYLRLRRVLRSSFMRHLTALAPGRLVAFVGDNWSSGSRKAKPYIDEKALLRARRFAEERYDEDLFDIMIAGHIHMKDEYEFKR